ncbi:MAG: peptidylprolyl isomerase [Qingshengfaniella sp.]
MRRIFQIFRTFLLTGGLALTGTLATAPMGLAQNLFAPVMRVNDGAITEFEIRQRAQLMTALRQTGNDRDSVLDALIEDRLKLDAAKAAGIEPGFDEVQLGLDDFAARVNLTGEELLQALGQGGIAPETVRDYVRVNLAWGELVRGRFARQARASDAEIDRALALGTGSGSARVLLSEIILPLTPELAEVTEERADAITQITTTAAFEDAARRFSVSPSRTNGGRLNWVALSELPGPLAPVLLTMRPGEVTDPFPIEGGVALFQFRGIEDIRPPLEGNVSLSFARKRMAPGTDLAAAKADLAGQTDGCLDLYGVYPGVSEQELSNETATRAQLSPSLARVLATLDPGEIGILPPQTGLDGGSLVMLCARTETREDSLTRDDVAQQLFLRRMNSYAEGYLAELRADAFIERP